MGVSRQITSDTEERNDALFVRPGRLLCTLQRPPASIPETAFADSSWCDKPTPALPACKPSRELPLQHKEIPGSEEPIPVVKVFAGGPWGAAGTDRRVPAHTCVHEDHASSRSGVVTTVSELAGVIKPILCLWKAFKLALCPALRIVMPAAPRDSKTRVSVAVSRALVASSSTASCMHTPCRRDSRGDAIIIITTFDYRLRSLDLKRTHLRFMEKHPCDSDPLGFSS